MRSRVFLLFDSSALSVRSILSVLVSFGTASSTIVGVVHCRQCTTKRAKSHQSPSGCRFTTRVLLLIMKRLAGFSTIAAANAARASSSERQIASVSSPYTRSSGLGG
jgi:hypothetical protein